MTDAAVLPPHEHTETPLLLALADAPPLVSSPAGWADLDDRGLLHVTGADAEAFLQGQLTQDLARVRSGHVLPAAHCTPKGRVSTLFRVWPASDGFLLDCPAELQAAAARRLRLYVLRAKVVITECAPAWCRTAVYGAEAPQWLAALGLTVPAPGDAPGAAAPHAVLALTGQRWLVLSTATEGAALRTALQACSHGGPGAQWPLACLRAGDPEVLSGSADAFIPQMLNLDQLDGISFRKGCYTGQEIVARSHYLGKVKRRMQHVAYLGSAPPQPGQMVAVGPARYAADGRVRWFMRWRPMPVAVRRWPCCA